MWRYGAVNPLLVRGRTQTPLLASASMQPALVDRRPVVLLGCLVAAAAVVRAALATQIWTPWIFVDELIHSDLARSVEEQGSFLVRGHHVTVSFVYPALLAPAWAARSATATYALAKTINAVVMSLAALPVYFWGRRFLSARGALAAAALTLCLPVFVLTGALMTENAFLPAFLLALYAAGLALERPTLGRQALLAAATALALATRVQGLLLVPIVASAVLVDAALARRWRRVSAFWPLGAVVGAAGLAYVLAKVAAGKSVFALGVYAGVRTAGYSAGGEARWLAYSAGELALALGVVPLCALAAVLARAREAKRPERAFLAVVGPAFVWSILLGGVSGAWEPLGLKERYMIHAGPLAFLALVLWVERGAPRPRWIAGVAAAAVALVAVLPLGTLFGQPALLGNDFGLIPFLRLSHGLGSVGVTRGLVIGGVVAAAALFLFLPRRLAFVLPAAVAVFLLVSSVPVFTTYRGEARAARERSGYGDNPSWVDEAAGRNAQVLFLNTANFEPETLQGRIVERFQPVWETEFWNRSFAGVVSLGVQEPAPLPQEATTLDWSTGRIAWLHSQYVLVRRRFPVVGRSLGAVGDLELFRSAGPVRLSSAKEGVDAGGTATGLAAYSVWAAPARSNAVHLSVERGPAVVRLGTIEALPGGGARIGRELGRRRIPAAGGSFFIPALRPPYRVEVQLLHPPAQVQFDPGFIVNGR